MFTNEASTRRTGVAFGQPGFPEAGFGEFETSGPTFRPVAVENPGGQRIQDKRDPRPEELIVVEGFGSKRVRLHSQAVQAWQAMVNAARAAGIAPPLLLPVSGYRSTQRQRRLFRNAVQRYGSERAARRWVAPPGRSAHHSGRAIDLYLGFRISSRYVSQMQGTAAWRWLRDNAGRFGFYPYRREPWHWEYNPPASVPAMSGGSFAAIAGAISSLPGVLSAALGRGTEMARLSAAIANGQRDENALTNSVFFARHPERGGRRIGRGERQAAAEWLKIRNKLVRPLLTRLPVGPSVLAGVVAGAGAGLAAGAATPSPAGAAMAQLSRLVETRNGAQVWSYQFTNEDLLWTARLIVGEAGGRDDPDNAAVIRALMNRYALFTRRVFPSFAAFLRAYSTTLQPVLRSAGAARRHMHRSSFVRTGGYYSKDPSVPRGQLQRHLDLQAKSWNRLPQTARSLATKALRGGIPDPGIGLASEFASTRIYFRSRHGGREPTDQEWRAYTENLARRKRWQWVGDVPGINQKKNAFFLDNRAAGRPASDVRVI